MVNPAHENTPHEEFARVEGEFVVAFTGPDGQPWHIRARPFTPESNLLREDPVLWRVEDADGPMQDALSLPDDLLAPADNQTPPSAPAEATDPLFPVGWVTLTPGAAGALHREGIMPQALLARHARGDWGDLDAHDRAVNREALRNGQRLLSAYTLPTTQAVIWVITEASRQTTTLLLPSEY